jgi:hypothetical protein
LPWSWRTILGPAALSALTSSIACLAGVFVVLYQSVGKLARDLEYSLSGKGIALIIALGAVSMLPTLLSISL